MTAVQNLLRNTHMTSSLRFADLKKKNSFGHTTCPQGVISFRRTQCAPPPPPSPKAQDFIKKPRQNNVILGRKFKSKEPVVNQTALTLL